MRVEVLLYFYLAEVIEPSIYLAMKEQIAGRQEKNLKWRKFFYKIAGKKLLKLWTFFYKYYREKKSIKKFKDGHFYKIAGN
jgi:hypothetical protein